MANRDLIVVGASAGGVAAMQQIVAGLPADLPAAVLMVLHMSRQSLLAQILNRAGPLRAGSAHLGEPIQRGRIYVARPGYHLLVKPGGSLDLFRGPRENGSRPAIDPLFRSAAAAYGPRVIGVLLTGTLDDGTAGLLAIKQAGGLAVVQDPADAEFAEMPAHAIDAVPVDHIVPLREMPALLAMKTQEELSEVTIAVGNRRRRGGSMRDEGNPLEVQATALTCPECGGVLTETQEGGLSHYRCYLGHAYSPYALDEEQSENAERALWHAIRQLEEQATFCRGLAGKSRGDSMRRFVRDLERKADEAERDAAVIREMLQRKRETAGENAVKGTAVRTAEVEGERKRER